LFVVLRGTALLLALAGFADLLFFGDEYERKSGLFYAHYQAANWSLVILACYPRLMFRLSWLFVVPLVVVSLVSAYEWNWLSRNEGLSLATDGGGLNNAGALLALGFAVEGFAAFVRVVNERANKRVRKW
jgi:hypothetical protein